ncbi:MAG TPA: PilZ domain-containing protein [Elusimicrobiota bacterium]|nr:PilZ domain-containing protein [Elusimicrobiota bacterium]
MNSKEKRRAPRAKHDSVLEIHDGAGQVILNVARLVDVSANGACFSSTTVFPVGQEVAARLRLLKEGLLEIRGRIIWAKKKSNATLYGIAFETAKQTPIE